MRRLILALLLLLPLLAVPCSGAEVPAPGWTPVTGALAAAAACGAGMGAVSVFLLLPM